MPASKRSRKRTVPSVTPKPAPVQVTQVDPIVLRLALDYADGDARRVDVISATSVIVRNNRVR
jgi:hypothetical protein